MSEQKQFVGRKKELDEFQGFLAGERDGPSGKGASVLLVVGDRGMGKTALLQAMAQEAADQDHFVIVGEIDVRQSEFSEQIYPLIAMLVAEKKLRPGAGRFWLKLGLAGLGTALGLPFLSELGGILKDVRDNHQATGSSLNTLAEIFHSSLSKVNGKLKDPQKLVVILDPEKESPPDIIPLLRNLNKISLPSKVRFVIAQRHKDAIITAMDEGELHHICADPMLLKKMKEDDSLRFIEAYDTKEKTTETTKNVLWERYGGWALLMELALDEIRKTKEDVNEQFIKSLPADIGEFWEKRYQAIREKESRILVQTVCLLPHPYPRNRLAEFASLDPDQMESAWNDKLIWCMLEKRDYEDALIEQPWSSCPAPRHETAREYVLERLKEDESLKQKRLSTIVSHYRNQIGEDLDTAGVDKDALVYLSVYLFESNVWCNVFSEMNMLTEIKSRYGLLGSLITDLNIALELCTFLKNQGDMAAILGNLGNVYQSLGDLDRAEAMYNKSLEINEALGRKEFMANQYGNLGNLYYTRGDLDQAEAMVKKSLEINEALGHKEGMASQYGNLGNVYLTRGDLDGAEALYEKSLEINEVLGRKEGIANQYGNLGNVYLDRGDLDGAEVMYKKCQEIDEALGRKWSIANTYGNLGNVYLTRGDLDRAEAMYNKSLEIDEALGHKEGMARDYSNLGEVCKERDDLEGAEAMWKKSLELYEAIGAKLQIEQVKGLIEELGKQQ